MTNLRLECPACDGTVGLETACAFGHARKATRSEAKLARLDTDGKAIPLTRLLTHAKLGDCISPRQMDGLMLEYTSGERIRCVK